LPKVKFKKLLQRSVLSLGIFTQTLGSLSPAQTSIVPNHQNESGSSASTPILQRNGPDQVQLAFNVPDENNPTGSPRQLTLDVQIIPDTSQVTKATMAGLIDSTTSPSNSKPVFMGHEMDSGDALKEPRTEDFGQDLNSFQLFLLKHQKAAKITLVVVRASVSATSAFASLGGGALLLPAIPALATYVSAMVDTNPLAIHWGSESIVAGALASGIFSGALLTYNQKINDWMSKDSFFRKVMKSVFLQAMFIVSVRLAAQGAHQTHHYLTTGTFDFLSVGSLLHELSIIFSSISVGFLTQNFWTLWIAEKQRKEELNLEDNNELSEMQQDTKRQLFSHKIDLLSCLNSVILNSVSLMAGSNIGGSGLKWMSYSIGGLGALMWYRLSRTNNRASQILACRNIFKH